MNCINQIILEGDVVEAPKMERGVCSVCISLTRHVKKCDGYYEDEVCYFDVEAYDRLAEHMSNYATKGRGIRIVGVLKQKRWSEPDGTTHSRVYVLAEHIEYKPVFNKEEIA